MHPDDKKRLSLSNRFNSVRNSLEEIQNHKSKEVNMGQKQLKNMKDRLRTELKFLTMKLNEIEPEIDAYRYETERMRRVNFLIQSRHNVDLFKNRMRNSCVSLSEVTQKLKRDFKQNKRDAKKYNSKSRLRTEDFKREHK